MIDSNGRVVKSVNPLVKDEDILRESGSTGFCSFNRLVEDYLNRDPNYRGRVNGFRVSDQGLEILFKKD